MKTVPPQGIVRSGPGETGQLGQLKRSARPGRSLLAPYTRTGGFGSDENLREAACPAGTFPGRSRPAGSGAVPETASRRRTRGSHRGRTFAPPHPDAGALRAARHDPRGKRRVHQPTSHNDFPSSSSTFLLHGFGKYDRSDGQHPNNELPARNHERSRPHLFLHRGVG